MLRRPWKLKTTQAHPEPGAKQWPGGLMKVPQPMASRWNLLQKRKRLLNLDWNGDLLHGGCLPRSFFFYFTKDVTLVKGRQEQFLPAEGAVNTQWNAKWRFMLQYDSNPSIPPITFARVSSTTILVNYASPSFVQHCYWAQVCLKKKQNNNNKY